jgi:phosphoesterase RecJ-like protein
MRTFEQEFRELAYVIKNAERILLFAHTRPDADSVGANGALSEYLLGLGKEVDIACYDRFPEALLPLGEKEFIHPDHLDLASYDAVFALDSVDRGFHQIADRLGENQVSVLIDHHPDIEVAGDVVIIDPGYSSTSELVYLFLSQAGARFSKRMASYLLAGILFDTGNLQHASVSPRVMEIVAALMKYGAPLSKISSLIYAHKDIAALRLWGRALERARLYPESGMLVTAVTQEDIRLCQASPEDIYQVASILSTVPDARFALVLSERDGATVRANLRTMEQHGVDVSAIAHRFGGGGHRLASGFELPGRIRETAEGFAIV